MSYLSVVQGLSPTNYWRLGESVGTTAVDAQGANNVTYSGTGVTYGTTALIADSDTGVTLDGAAGKITGYNLVNTPATQTVVAWIKSGATAAERAVWSRRTGVGGEQIWGSSNSGKIFAYMQGDTTGTYSGLTNIYDDVAHMLVWTLEGSALKMYVDGIPEVEVTLDSGWTGATGSSGTAPFIIGEDGTLNQGYWNGILDEVAFWNGTALSAANVRALYTAGLGVTFGTANIGSGADDGVVTDYNQVSVYTLPVDGVATHLAVYFDGAGSGSGSQTLKGVIYADSGGVPGALKAVSSAVVVADGQAAGFVNFPIAATALTAGDYWLGVIASTTSQASRFYKNPRANGTTYNADTYADGPADPYGTGDGFSGGAITARVAYTPSAEDYLSIVLGDNPLAVWPLQETSGTNADEIVGGYDGTYSGTYTLDQASLLSEDATLNSVLFTSGSVSTNFEAFAAATPVTVEGWAQRTNNSANYTLFGGDSGVGQNPLLRIASGSNDISFWSDTDQASVTWPGAAPAPGVPFHWVLEWSGSSKSARLYINAICQGQALLSTDMSTREFEIGAWGGSGDPFNGQIALVAIYSGELTTRQIVEHYEAGAGMFATDTYPVEVLADSPEVYWRLAETSGTAVDNIGSAGSAADGTANATIVSDTSLLATDPMNGAQVYDWNGATFKVDTTYALSQMEPVTMEFLVEPRSLAAFGGGINHSITHGQTGQGIGCSYFDTTGQWRFTTFGILDYDFIGRNAQVGVTNHVVFVLDASHDVTLYIDGAKVGTVAGSSAPNATGAKLALAYLTGQTAGANAVFDEVAVYPAALSADRVLAHYIASFREVEEEAATTAFPVSIPALSGVGF
jgi:hypothetical protein